MTHARLRLPSRDIVTISRSIGQLTTELGPTPEGTSSTPFSLPPQSASSDSSSSPSHHRDSDVVSPRTTAKKAPRHRAEPRMEIPHTNHNNRLSTETEAHISEAAPGIVESPARVAQEGAAGTKEAPRMRSAGNLLECNDITACIADARLVPGTPGDDDGCQDDFAPDGDPVDWPLRLGESMGITNDDVIEAANALLGAFGDDESLLT